MNLHLTKLLHETTFQSTVIWYSVFCFFFYCFTWSIYFSFSLLKALEFSYSGWLIFKFPSSAHLQRLLLVYCLSSDKTTDSLSELHAVIDFTILYPSHLSWLNYCKNCHPKETPGLRCSLFLSYLLYLFEIVLKS